MRRPRLRFAAGRVVADGGSGLCVRVAIEHTARGARPAAYGRIGAGSTPSPPTRPALAAFLEQVVFDLDKGRLHVTLDTGAVLRFARDKGQ